MTVATVIVNEKTIKVESAPVNINIQSASVGRFGLIRFMDKTYSVNVMPGGLQMTVEK